MVRLLRPAPKLLLRLLLLEVRLHDVCGNQTPGGDVPDGGGGGAPATIPISLGQRDSQGRGDQHHGDQVRVHAGTRPPVLVAATALHQAAHRDIDAAGPIRHPPGEGGQAAAMGRGEVGPILRSS